ncbi:helix-turn-helix domain-containing protein [Alicyclobacillus herbarius]|uniref:helix-turn-helix domain-containing protein n=1 Tax=Alicyclobacillus herbarius TaxID=122960 RepID=UPI000416509E|nr:helix-turn-helix domain-containing protein [Alicyclobacillus herbarius]
MTSIGAKVREIRQQRGMTQAELANGIVTSSMISQIESDKARPSYALLCQLANRLGTSAEYFLGELGDHYTPTTMLRTAEYWLLVGQPKKALEALNQLPVPDPPGYDYLEYHLLLVQAQNMLGQYTQAVPLIERLREYALQTQEQRALLRIHKVSGQVEYAMNNPDGAMHEWENAVLLGERLAADSEYSHTQLETELTEVYLWLYQLLHEQGRTTEATAWVERALRRAPRLTGLHSLAESLVQDADRALARNDPGGARALMDQAVAFLEAARHLEGQLHLESLGSTKPSWASPWLRAGLAIASDGQSLVQIELHLVERLLQEGQYQAALERIEECWASFPWPFGDQSRSEAKPSVALRLRLLRARAWYGIGDVEHALQEVMQVAESAKRDHDITAMLDAYEYLLQWLLASETVDTETALLWSVRADELIDELSGRIGSCPL